MLTILNELVSRPSITPEDAGCSDYMIDFLTKLGFQCQSFNQKPVTNFFARLGTEEPLLVFAGHTDVVPPGNIEKWTNSPFALVEKDGLLYGRGVADMKGSLACMLSTAKRFVETHPTFKGSLGFLITSAEEGDEFNKGTPYVMKKITELGIKPSYCIVGEPSSIRETGDMVKIGRRGSLSGKVTLNGKQGHVAYPHLAVNPIHLISPILAELTATVWDNGNEFFPPTSFQITHVSAGGQANNIIPGELTLHFNFRYSTEQNEGKLQEKVTYAFQEHGLNPKIEWLLNGKPFLTKKGVLVETVQNAIKKLTGLDPEFATCGGTSDGRFIAPYGIEVLELGPTNATIHQVDECLPKKDLETLEKIYLEICENLLA